MLKKSENLLFIDTDKQPLPIMFILNFDCLATYVISQVVPSKTLNSQSRGYYLTSS